MAKVKRNGKNKEFRLKCDDPDDSFYVHYTNRGEQFREGLEIGIENRDFDKEVLVMLEDREAKYLRDYLISHYPIDNKIAPTGKE